METPCSKPTKLSINMTRGKDSAYVTYHLSHKVYLYLLVSNSKNNLSSPLSFLLDIAECRGDHELHNCSSYESCVNQIRSFICFAESTGCNGSESS